MESRARNRENRKKMSSLCLEKKEKKNLRVGNLLNCSTTGTCACVRVCACDTDVHRPKRVF